MGKRLCWERRTACITNARMEPPSSHGVRPVSMVPNKSRRPGLESGPAERLPAERIHVRAIARLVPKRCDGGHTSRSVWHRPAVEEARLRCPIFVLLLRADQGWRYPPGLRRHDSDGAT